MERSIEAFAAINFIIMGLSHLTQPRAWIEFFTLLRNKGEAGAFVNGFITLGMGSLIVAFHLYFTPVLPPIARARLPFHLPKTIGPAS